MTLSPDKKENENNSLEQFYMAGFLCIIKVIILIRVIVKTPKKNNFLSAIKLKRRPRLSVSPSLENFSHCAVKAENVGIEREIGSNPPKAIRVMSNYPNIISLQGGWKDEQEVACTIENIYHQSKQNKKPLLTDVVR